MFTTLRLALETDGVINDAASIAQNYIGTDSLWPLQAAGTGTFISGASDWQGYSVTLHTAPFGYTGFTMYLDTSTARTSPGVFYILMATQATSIASPSADPSTPVKSHPKGFHG